MRYDKYDCAQSTSGVAVRRRKCASGCGKAKEFFFGQGLFHHQRILDFLQCMCYFKSGYERKAERTPELSELFHDCDE